VAAALTVAVLGAAVAALWIRRQRGIDAAKAVAAAGPTAVRRRADRRAQSEHDRLVRSVRERASVLKLKPPNDVVDTVEGAQPAIVTHHPTKRVFYLYDDPTSYRDALERGEVLGWNAGWGHRPTPLKKRSDEWLRNWLEAHKDAEPD
jgi:hypothetical protein